MARRAANRVPMAVNTGALAAVPAAAAREPDGDAGVRKTVERCDGLAA